MPCFPFVYFTDTYMRKILFIINPKSGTDKKIFVDTNISIETLHKISDQDHVLIMLADPEISVNRFFES